MGVVECGVWSEAESRKSCSLAGRKAKTINVLLKEKKEKKPQN